MLDLKNSHPIIWATAFLIITIFVILLYPLWFIFDIMRIIKDGDSLSTIFVPVTAIVIWVLIAGKLGLI